MHSLISFAVTVLVLGVFATSALAEGQPDDSPSPQNSEAILVVFPDYPINSDFYGYEVNFAGHAGVLLIDSSGLTKYYEFGRYDTAKQGRTRSPSVSNVVIGPRGKATPESLKVVLAELSQVSGDNGRIRAAYFVNMDFDKMKSAAGADQPTYSVASFNCGHFAEKIILSGHSKVDKPLIINFLPNNVVDEYIEEGNAEITYDPVSGAITIGDSDESDAKE